jgi:hypothetical protein
MAIHTKKCPNCEKDYTTTVAQKTYCSILCRYEFKKKEGYTAIKEFYSLDGEIWKDVVGYEGFYKISNKGRFCRVMENGTLQLRKLNKGDFYYRVALSKYNTVKQESVHRLVATAFIPNTHNKPVVNHIDANPLNNCVENLEWCTPAENLQHAVNLGNLKLRGTNNNQCILNEERVREMRRLKKEENLRVSEIARRFEIKHGTAWRAINGSNWAWLD